MSAPAPSPDIKRRSMTRPKMGARAATMSSAMFGRHGGVRKHVAPSKRPDIGWIPLTDEHDSLKERELKVKGYPTWEELRALDVKRKLVLGYARDLTPMDTVGRLNLLRRTVLPRLLREILETRFMVKRAMKQVPVSSPLHRTLNARQFGLKLIANVTYGYTSASFSGRMPNVHIADARSRALARSLNRRATRDTRASPSPIAGSAC